jgi:23S rRNA pseudouridine1911/1915/1917 synthase
VNEITILYDDDQLVVINKPAGVVVHPGAGETGETVVDWLTKNYPAVRKEAWAEPERAGIVHRLDKDTSGIMIVAKTITALQNLQAQFKARTIEKMYTAITVGEPPESEGTVRTYIGRHQTKRQQQAWYELPLQDSAKEAVTNYRVDAVYHRNDVTFAKIFFYPKTGRMHQLRVHAKYLGTPILGDALYSSKLAFAMGKILGVERQMLHATTLTFNHPVLNKILTFNAPLPADMQAILKALQSQSN